MTDADGPVALIAEFTTTPENRAEVAGLIAAYGDVVRAQPGNRAVEADTLGEGVVQQGFLIPAL